MSGKALDERVFHVGINGIRRAVQLTSVVLMSAGILKLNGYTFAAGYALSVLFRN